MEVRNLKMRREYFLEARLKAGGKREQKDDDDIAPKIRKPKRRENSHNPPLSANGNCTKIEPKSSDACSCNTKQTPVKPSPPPPPKPVPPPPSPAPVSQKCDVVETKPLPKKKKKDECGYCQNRFCKLCDCITPRATVLVEMTDIDSYEMETAVVPAPKDKETKPRSRSRSRSRKQERNTKADSGDDDFCSCCTCGGGTKKRSKAQKTPACKCSGGTQVGCSDQPTPTQTCPTQTPPSAPAKSTATTDDCISLQQETASQTKASKRNRSQNDQTTKPKQRPEDCSVQDEGRAGCSQKCTSCQQPLVTDDITVNKANDGSRQPTAIEICNLNQKINDILNKVNALQRQITRQTVDNAKIRALDGKIMQINKTIDDMKKTCDQRQVADTKCIDKRCQIKAQCDKNNVIQLRQYTPLTNSSICVNCRNQGSGGLLEKDLQCVILRMIDDLQYSDVVLTVLLQADNIYHINVRTLMNKSIGCIYATNEAVAEAQKLNLFEDILTFLVVDTRATIRPQNRMFGNSFEYVNSKRQPAGSTSNDLKLLYDNDSLNVLKHDDSSVDRFLSISSAYTIESEDRLLGKAYEKSKVTGKSSQSKSRSYCIVS